jgi:ATP-dependent helicase/DNAse subunit B
MQSNSITNKLSYSALDTFKVCQWKYKLKFIDRVTPFIPIRYLLVTGVAFHELVSTMYKTNQFTFDFLRKNWKSYFMTALEKEGSSFADTSDYEKYLKYGYGLIARFFKFAQQEGYLIKPIASEWKFTIKLPLYKVTGQVDLIIKRETQPFVEIIDFKTGWSVPTLEQVNQSDQLKIYDWAVRRTLGFKDTKVGLFFPRKSKVILIDEYSKDYISVQKKFIEMSKVLKSGILLPNLNACKNCEIQKHCKYFKI